MGINFRNRFFFSARFARGVFRTLSKIWDGALFISSKQFLAGQLLSQPKLHLIQPFVKILNTPLTYLLKISNVLCRMSDSELLSELLFLKCFKRTKKYVRRTLLTEIKFYYVVFLKPFQTFSNSSTKQKLTFFAENFHVLTGP